MVHELHELHAEDRLAIGEVLSLHGNPVAHHVTNIVISGESDGTVTALSKGLVLRADRTLASVNHHDTLRRHDGGWRIGRRVISPQDTPLGGAHLADAGTR